MLYKSARNSREMDGTLQIAHDLVGEDSTKIQFVNLVDDFFDYFLTIFLII